MLAWRVEKPSLTGSLVRPFTFFEAAQSSRTMRVLVSSENKIDHFQPKFDPRVSVSEAEKGLVISEVRAYEPAQRSRICHI